MKKILSLILLLSTASILFAGNIDKATAIKVAMNFYYERANQFEETNHWDIIPDGVYELQYKGETRIYAVNIYKGGFVLISASDKVRPVAGYSLHGRYSDQGQPPQMAELLELYKMQIDEAIEHNVKPTDEVNMMWQRLKTDNLSELQNLRDEKSIEPMLTTTWDQGQFYNEMCPADPAGPAGHCYTGCVATALGQLVNYFRWPETGTGSYTYACPPYGDLTADYENTTYEWDKMATELNKSNLAVALMINHMGIGCDMVYGPNGSGMYNHRAAYVLRTFFKYSPETIYVYRDSTTMDWDSLLITHLDAGIPMYYAGWSVPNINGHAFIVDGYQADYYYHFNWGWSGSFDGYFYTDNMNPGGSNFNLAQELIIHAVPDTNAYVYPYYCTGDKVLENTDGTIDDGSGPIYNYTTDADCSWLIAPIDSVENISIEFLRFNTEAGDIVYVYDGETTSAPLLGSFEGSAIPNEITSTGDRILITFTTDGTGSAPGWLLSYTSKIPVYCNGMSNLNEQSGYLSDGSGPRDYHNSTTCMWMIDPPGATELTIYFTSFNTEETNDVVKVFDLETQELITELSGDITPSPVTSPSGRMFLTFSTNYTTTAPGWEAYYETDLVGIYETKLNRSLKIFPNPASNHVNLSWTSDSQERISVIVSSMTGQQLIRHQEDSGNHFVKLDVSGLTAGIYLIEVSNNIEKAYRKIVIE